MIHSLAGNKEDLAMCLVNSNDVQQSFATHLNLSTEDVAVMHNSCTLAKSNTNAVAAEDLVGIVALVCSFLKRRNENISWMGGRLPTEIIAEILGYVWDLWDADERAGRQLGKFSSSLSPDPHAWGSPYSRLTCGIVPPWFILSLVCTKWRDIIHSTPSLWTSLFLLIKSEHSIDRVCLGMEMAQRAIDCWRALDVSLCFESRPGPLNFLSHRRKMDKPTPSDLEMISQLRSFYEYALQYARSLHIEARDMFLQPLISYERDDALNFQWPELESLTLVLHSEFCNRCDIDVPETDTFLRTPKLRRLWLSAEHGVPCLSFAWSNFIVNNQLQQLTHLTIHENTDEPSDLRDLLWECAPGSLQVCEIRMLGWKSSDEDYLRYSDANTDPQNFICFPHLTYLFLDFNRYITFTNSDPNDDAADTDIPAGYRLNTYMAPIFYRLSLPALRTLRIFTPVPPLNHQPNANLDFSLFTSEDFGLIQLQQRSGFAHLEQFQLNFPGIGGPQLCAFLRAVPGLKSLELIGTDYVWNHVLYSMWIAENKDDDSTNELGASIPSAPMPLQFSFLPNLQRLLIREYDDIHVSNTMYEWQAQMLFGMLRKRCSVPEEQFSLREVILDIKRNVPGRLIIPLSILSELTKLPKEVQVLLGSGVGWPRDVQSLVKDFLPPDRGASMDFL